jgi:hypothetical protein
MAGYIARTEGVSISHHYVAKLWRDNGIQPHRQGTFKISKDPEFAEKVADIVGRRSPDRGACCRAIPCRPQAVCEAGHGHGRENPFV